MKARDLMQGLARRLRLSHWQADAQGACALSFPDGLKVDLCFVEGMDGLCFVATLGTLTDVSRNEAMSGLLLANRIFSEQGEPWFALDLPSGTVHFCRTLFFGDQTVEAVLEDLDRLTHAARSFRNLLAQRQQVLP